MEDKIKELENKIENIEKRNKKVEGDKVCGTSLFKKNINNYNDLYFCSTILKGCRYY